MAYSFRNHVSAHSRLLLGIFAVSGALCGASGCDYDERRLRVSRVAVDEAGANGGGLDAAGGSDHAPVFGGDAGQASLTGATSAGTKGIAGSSGSGGNAGVGASIAGSGGSTADSSGASAGSTGSGSSNGGSAGSNGGSAGLNGGSAGLNGGSDGSNGGSDGSNGGSDGSNGGTAGSHGNVISGPCGDIDGNQIDDCSETLLQNSRFDLNLDHWSAEAQVTSAWDAQNATSLTTSGSAKLVNTVPVASAIGLTMAGAEQCLQISGGAGYQVAARVLIPAGQGEGQAGVNLWVFGGDDCKSNFLVAITPAMTQTVGAWTTAQGVATLPAGAKSMIVRLVALKPFTQTQLQVSFDDVLVRTN